MTYSPASDWQAHTDLIMGFTQGTDHLALSGLDVVAACGYSNNTVVHADKTILGICGVSTKNVPALA